MQKKTLQGRGKRSSLTMTSVKATVNIAMAVEQSTCIVEGASGLKDVSSKMEASRESTALHLCSSHPLEVNTCSMISISLNGCQQVK